MKRKILFGFAAMALPVLFGAYTLFAPMLKGGETAFVFVDNDDTGDSITTQLRPIACWPQRWGVSVMASLTRYGKNPPTGRYALREGESALGFFMSLRGRKQEPVGITIPMVRTMEDLAGFVSRKLMIDSTEFVMAVRDSAAMAELGVDTANAYCLFIPNTYEFYWDIPLPDFLKRMGREAKAFWNDTRLAKAKAIPLSPDEVYTLASIIDEETANNGEKPEIAGMYINRLRARMPLQADPTIKYALRRFDIRRIYHSLLETESPYNTYRNTGLPPGPIRIASVAGIDAVLNHSNHNFLYMCAKEDFSGTHNFAATYSEHLRNARKYTEALNKRGIR